MRICLCILIAFWFSGDLPAQINGYFGELGVSYAQNRDNGYREEFTFRNSVGLLIGQNWAVGMKFHHIYFNSRALGSEYLRIIGPFGRWGLYSEKVRLYFETGINWGNYRTFGNFASGVVYKESGLLYISFGPGLEGRVTRGVWFQMSLRAHEIINRPQPTSGLSAILFGLSFDLKRRSRIQTGGR